MGWVGWGACLLMWWHRPQPQKRPQPWQAYLTVAVIVVAIIGCIEGIRADACMISALGVFAVTNILTTRQAFGGFGKSTVVGLAFVFPICSALEETGVLQRVLQIFLGTTSNESVAMARVML